MQPHEMLEKLGGATLPNTDIAERIAGGVQTAPLLGDPAGQSGVINALTAELPAPTATDPAPTPQDSAPTIVTSKPMVPS